MKSEWRVMKNPIGDEMTYGVYRLYDKQKVMHSGNVEIAGYYDCKEDAIREADRLNAKENTPIGAATPEQGARETYHLQNKPKKTVCQMEKKNEQNEN